MDTVKQGRTKVIKEGDCVSVPNDYFGTDYLVALQTVGVTEDQGLKTSGYIRISLF